MEQQADNALRERLISHIKGGEAFLPIEKVLEKISFEYLGTRPKDFPYSFYELFYHIHLAQKDLLEYSRDPFQESPAWPEDFWPEDQAPDTKEDWDALIDEYFAVREEIFEFLRDPEQDLTEPFGNGSGHTLLRQTLLVIEHAAYHNGQLLLILRSLGLHG